jgi:DNA polymerase III delta prime subunit
MTPEEFILNPDELIGRAGKLVEVQRRKIRSGRASIIRLLLHGPPGCGKSAALRMIAAELTGEGYQVSHLSACEITADMVRGWIDESHYKRDGWRVYWIEECDAINPTAEVLMLQFLDKLPAHTAVLCTSNYADKLTDRFQSRLQVVEIARPSTQEIDKLLKRRFGDCYSSVIAHSCKGDLRAALNDAQAYLDYHCEVEA